MIPGNKGQYSSHQYQVHYFFCNYKCLLCEDIVYNGNKADVIRHLKSSLHNVDKTANLEEFIQPVLQYNPSLFGNKRVKHLDHPISKKVFEFAQNLSIFDSEIQETMCIIKRNFPKFSVRMSIVDSSEIVNSNNQVVYLMLSKNLLSFLQLQKKRVSLFQVRTSLHGTIYW